MAASLLQVPQCSSPQDEESAKRSLGEGSPVVTTTSVQEDGKRRLGNTTKPLKGCYKHMHSWVSFQLGLSGMGHLCALLGSCVSCRNPCVFISEFVSTQHLPVGVKISGL